MPQISFNIVMQMLVLLIKEVNVMAKKLKFFFTILFKKEWYCLCNLSFKMFRKKMFNAL